MSQVFGIGTDIVHILRIEKIIFRFKEALAKRVLSTQEYAHYQTLPWRRHAAYLAKRFAAKEAIVKALGMGMTKGIQFKEIAIMNNALGQPYVHYQGEAAKHIAHHRIKNTLISLSDEKDYAIAFVTLLQ